MKHLPSWVLPVFLVVLLLGVSLASNEGSWWLLNDFCAGADGSKGAYLSTYYPYYLTVIESIYVLFAVHALYRPAPGKDPAKHLFLHGILTTSFSAILLILSVIKLIQGKYYLGMATLSAIFPVDLFLFQGLFLSLGILALVFHKKVDLSGTSLPLTTKPVFQVLRNIGFGILIIFTLFFTGAALNTLWTFDTSMKYWGPMFFVYLDLWLPLALVLVYELGYLTRKEPVAQTRFQILSSAILGGISLILFVGILISEKIAPNFLTEAGTSLFPVDHQLMSSKAFGPILLLLLTLIPSLSALIQGILKQKKTAVQPK
jgi:sensor histidine kinase YesM